MFIVIFTERECVVLNVFCPGCLSVFLCPVTGDMVPYLNCSGGDYISHHNTRFFSLGKATSLREGKL